MSVYAASDWHGCYWVWEQIKEILKPDDKLYFLGDAADRGPDGWRIIKELIVDPRVIYIKGNHEDLLVKAMRNKTERLFKDYEFYWDRNMELWFYNGGEVTHDAIVNDSIPASEKVNIINKLKSLPFCCIYHNDYDFDILLSHAGCNSFDDAGEVDEYDFIWDRNHWLYPDVWYGKDTEFIIHGHTPIESMIEKQEYQVKGWNNKHPDKEIRMPDYMGFGAYWYAQGHKICIDTGTVWNKTAVLFNLDTLEEIELEV